ncbi:MAG: zinc metalloprotease HtpX [Acidimicrobiales bacterium]|nr:zinc metalloprotease HtpX [Acidimicrobiales bacterium]MBO0887311.1 zinc metalloprotease HtpX [Acidimicrobiales bacterium]MBO0893708.1 zinc metalloprotease HtpX [Acidimicrobiales bacterium]
MAAHRFPKDRGLSTRMAITMFLLGLLYVAFIAVLFALNVSIVGIVVIAGLLLGAQYWFSDKIALFAMGGREVTPEQAPVLHGIVDRLCAMSNTPKPRVAIADVDMPNAFATGRNQRAAVVCATTGILRRLDEPELEGVLAHELSHVAHRDVAVMTIASFLGVLAGLITRFALFAGMFGGFGGRNNNQGGSQTALLELGVLLVSVLVYALSFLLIRALSRYRELSADRSGAILTGRPSALASALIKVSGEMGRIPTRDLRKAEAFNAFFFTPALSSGTSLASIFATHPSLERRLEQLSRIEAQLGRQV